MDKIKFFPNSFSIGFVILIPILNAISSVTVNYFPAFSLNPGTFRAALIFLFFLIYFLPNLSKNRSSKVVYFFLAYFFILCFLTTDIFYSLYVYYKVFLSMIMLPIGYYFIDTEENFIRLNYAYLVSLFVLTGYLIISNIFSLGESTYLEDSFYFGSARVNITKNMTILVLVSPIALSFVKSRRNRYITILLILVSIIFIFIGVKRTAIGSLIVGFIIYSIFSPSKLKSLKYITYFFAFLFIFSPLYWDTLVERYEARESRGAFDTEVMEERDPRYNEYKMVIKSISERPLPGKIFGTNLFNEKEYYETDRVLHTDYMTVLHGSGILGLFLFFYIYIVIISESNTNKILFEFDKKFLELHVIIFSLLAASLIISIAGSLKLVEIRGYIFLYIGAILGYMKKERRLLILNNKT